MKSKTYILIFSLSLVLILSACNNQKSTGTAGFGFVGGTEALTSSFVTEEPPNSVYDGDSNAFRISLQIENKGEYTVDTGELLATLVGIRYDQFQIKKGSLENIAPIEGARLEAGEVVYTGVTTDISYEAKYKGKVPADQSFDLGVNYCYKYQTDATADICLQKDVTRRPEETDKCSIEGEKTTGNSGGPLQVSSVRERPSGENKVQLLMLIENLGEGDVYDPSYLSEQSECVEQSDKKNKLKMKVSFENENPEVTCDIFDGKNEGTVSLIDGKQTVLCRVDTSSLTEPAPFTQRPNIVLDYVYKEHVSTKVTVQRSSF